MIANERPLYLANSDKSNTKPLLPEKSLLERIRDSRMTDLTPVKRLKPVVMVGGSIFARRGDFSVITGQRKAGKTTVLQFVVATALLAEVPADLDTLQIRSEYCHGKDVIYVDTEGSEEDTADFINGVKRVMGVDEQPPFFHTYHWRPFSVEDCRKGIDLLFAEHPNAHLWIIDGVADLVKKPNDEEESNLTVRWIMSMAGQLDTCMILVIHENPSRAGQDTKLRGHLGSELERKASGAIGIEKNKELKEHYIKSRFLRKSADFDSIVFRFDEQLGRPVHRIMTPDEHARLKDPNRLLISEYAQLRDRCFLGTTSKSEKHLKASILLYQKPSPTDDAARTKRNNNFKAMLRHNLIRREDTADDVIYHRVDPKGEPLTFEIEQTDE